MIVLVKKRSLILIALAVVLSICGFLLTKNNSYYLETVTTPGGSKGIVVVDAGHGGMDGGAVSKNGTMEKDINLNIAKRLEYYLTENGYTTVMTRISDTSLNDDSNASVRNKKREDLKKRKDLVENSGAFAYVSIHLNKFEQSSVKGAQVFYGKNNEGSKDLAECIRLSIVDNVDSSNQRILKPGDDSIFLLKNITIPAVIVECGFISNPDDEKLLQSEDYQDKLALAIYKGIENYVLKLAS